jgi:hypothetical protein
MTPEKSRLTMIALLSILCLIVTGCPCDNDCTCQDGGVDAGQDAGQDAGTDGDDQPESVKGFGPASRWIGWQHMDTETLDLLANPCPPPRVADTNWWYGRLFSPRDVLEQMGGLNAQDQPNDIGEKLLTIIDSVGTPDDWYRGVVGDGVFCLYEWRGDPVSEEQSEDLMSQIPLIRTGAPDPDPPALVPLDMTPEELIADIHGRFHLHALEQLGASGYTPAVGLGQSPVIVAVMDSAVTDYGDPATGQGLPGNGQLVHGRDVGLLLRRMTCPDNQAVDARTGCKIGLANYLVLDREPDEAGGTRINRIEGGYFGTPGTLAEMIWWTVVMWQYRNPDAKLVINMSVGWEETGPHLARTDHVVQSVRAALSNARCAGALPIVAAGNKSGSGPNPSTGPMGPAFFESYDWDGCDPVAPASESIVFSVGGIDGAGQALASTRVGGRPHLAAYAYQVPADEQYLVPSTPADPVFGSPPLTGTSMSAAATSAIAAMLWSYSPDVPAGQVMEVVFETGTKVDGVADYCFGPLCTIPYEIHRVSLCAALDSVGAILPGTCVEPVYQNPTWSDEQLAEADLIATGVQLPTLTSQPAPVQECGADTSIYFDAQGQLPLEICPDATYTNYIPMPQLVPQPRKPVCPTCGFISDSLYIGDDSGTGLIASLLLDATPGTVGSVRLKLSNASETVYYDIQSALVPGEILRLDGFVLPAGFVPELAEVIAILTGHTGTTITLNGQIPVMH